MIITLWIVAFLNLFGGLASVATVGKPRTPITGGQAVFIVVFVAVEAGALIAAALTLAGR